MKDIENEIEQTLNSFNDRAEVKVKPYFYTRLSAKMDVDRTQSASRLRWSIAAIVVIVLVNLISILSIPSETDEQFDPIEMMATEYSSSNTDIYNTTLEEQP